MDFAEAIHITGIKLRLFVTHFVLEQTQGLQHAKFVVEVGLLIEGLNATGLLTLGVHTTDHATESSEVFSIRKVTIEITDILEREIATCDSVAAVITCQLL